MQNGQGNRLIRYMSRVIALEKDRDCSDQALLQRFVSVRDEGAFAALLERHGGTVLGVCRRMLSNGHDAEDAFQATFLVLASKADQLAQQRFVGSWLYGAAYRISLQSRRETARRRGMERVLDDVPEVPVHDEAAWRDLRLVLDEEVNRLPAKYRLPVVLCYFEGRTYAEAADLLGLPAGTLSIRLTRARELLRKRLTRRGVTLTGAALTTCLAENIAAAAVPAPLADATLKAALLVAAGTAAGLSSPVALLTKEGIKAMSTSKLKTTLVLAVIVLCSSVSMMVHNAVSADPPAVSPKDKAAAGADKPAERKNGTGDVVVRLRDGTSVRGIALQVNLDVTMKYGKLTVPLADVRFIEFGLRVPDEVARKIDEHIKRLGSDNFQQREEATSELIAHGRQAYPALLKAAKGSDLETTRRLEAILERIRDDLGDEEPKIAADDTICTSEGTLKGRVMTPTLKIKTTHLGELQPQLAHIQSIHAIETAQVAIDAAKFSTSNKWMDAGFAVDASMGLVITATGKVDLDPQQVNGAGPITTGPEGSASMVASPDGVNNYRCGVLLGRIGEDGEIFEIGRRYEGKPGQTGKLYLHVLATDFGGGEPSGSYKVKATSDPGATNGKKKPVRRDPLQGRPDENQPMKFRQGGFPGGIAPPTGATPVPEPAPQRDDGSKP